MKLNIHGDKVEVTSSIKDYIEKKLGKLDKYFDKPDDIDCKVVIRVRGNLQIVEVTILTSKFTIRCEEGHDDLYESIDIIVDKLERMIRKNKTRLINHYKNASLLEFDFENILEEEAETSVIAKRKRINSKPMSEEEAILQMELLNHDFFVFKNIDEDCTSVLYRRKDGLYGIINID